MDNGSPQFRPIDRGLHEVLIVDDDPASRYATARTLRNAGFRTREAATGHEGMSAADDGISAMVLDVHLPDISGFELCRMLRSRADTARLPVLHLTASYVSDEDKVHGLDAGADAYLTHPVEPAVLVATVQALVRARVAEDAMRRSESKFRAIYAQAPSGIGLLDGEGRFLDVNPALLSMLDRGAGEVLGRAVSEFTPPEWAERVNAYLGNVATETGRQEFPLLGPTGKVVHLEWTVSPHIEPRVNMVMATDISARIVLEQQRQQLLDRERAARSDAEQVSRMKDDLIAVLSHELRTPLSVILGWTHILQKRGGTPETMRGLELIERNGRIQAKLIEDLLDMSRLNLGKLPLNLDLLDPSDVLASAVSSMQPALDESAHRLELDLQPPYRQIRADGARLQQIIWNLISNAIKFSPRGSQIDVSLLQDERGLMLRVSDEGQGIEPAFLPLVFERFAQSDSRSNRQRGGLGLGLAIVKQLVEAHGGAISVASAGLGQGSSFEVWFPLASDAAEGDEADVPSEAGELDPLAKGETVLDGLRLLIVDDEPEGNAMLQMILSDRGAVVSTAFDCDTALGLMAASEFDLLVSDIGMPGKDGYDLIRELRRREADRPGVHLPAIALTAFSRARDREQALGAGFDAHCAKPLRPLKLIWQIQRLLRPAETRADDTPV